MRPIIRPLSMSKLTLSTAIVEPNAFVTFCAVLALTICQAEYRFQKRGLAGTVGLDPFKQRKELMQNICFIADVAVLPRWIKVAQLLDYVEDIHPRFTRAKADELLSKTKIHANSKVRELSKGMVTQLHLSIITAVDAKLLVLDEPTLGLDIIFRKDFYSNLLNDYFDGERTIVITTHQVEEIENLLTDVMFINDGRIILNSSVDSLADNYVELMTSGENAEKARALAPINERDMFGKSVMIFEGVERAKLNSFGDVRTPDIADLFVAKVKGHSK